MNEDSAVVRFPQPEAMDDPLTAVLRAGARRWKQRLWRRIDLDLPLLGACIEHRRWVERIGELLARPPGEIGDAPPLDPDECRFGRWYDGPGRSRYGHHPAWRAADALHRAVHGLGAGLLALHLAGEAEPAQAGLAELYVRRDELLERLGDLVGEYGCEHLDSP